MSILSPVRKRQRLSSPDYDRGFWEPDDDAIQEISRIELTLSQLVRNQKEMDKEIAQRREETKKKRLAAIMAALGESPDPETNSEQHSSSPQPQSSPIDKRKREEEEDEDSDLMADDPINARIGHELTPDKGREQSLSPGDNAPIEPDYSKWFESVDSSNLPGFQRLSKVTLDAPHSPGPVSPGFTPAGFGHALPGFAKASITTQDNSWIEPSKDALEKAARKMQSWAKEDDELQQPSSNISEALVEISEPSGDPTPSRPALATVSNSPTIHSTTEGPSTPDMVKGKEKNRGFKSPLSGNASSRPLYPKGGPGVQNMPIHYPGASKDPTYLQKFGRIPHPLSSTPITASPDPSPLPIPLDPPSTPKTSFSTPGSKTKKRQYKTAFTTPFKPGMRPGEPGYATLQKSRQVSKAEPQNQPKHQENSIISLKESGLLPQRYTPDELSYLGLNTSAILRINPRTARYFTFYRTQPQRSLVRCLPQQYLELGADAALDHLHKTGRIRATREWVLNAYAFILWKLAGMACLDPERESTDNPRWGWEEVVRQIEERYKREIENGVRPPLKAIADGDSNPSSPMVLLVSDVIEEEATPDKPGTLQLEVSDGWYRLRAVIDEPLKRAVRSGKIRVGRKLAVAGAKILSPKKESMDILKAYDIISFRLQGNGSHLAPWHAKLGFQKLPYVSTLNSLTPDGGMVFLMDLIVEKVYPIAYLEFITSQDGKQKFAGPRCEVEEAGEAALWKDKREAEETKLRCELQARWSRWEGLAERLEAAAGSQFNPSEDTIPPDDVEDSFDELEDIASSDVGAFVRKLSPAQAGWLARFIQNKMERDKELAFDEIESELKMRCPPRDVRNFRVLIVRDAQTIRRPAHRRAELTIWDVMSLVVSEGAQPGAIEAGQRFRITNLEPSQVRSWMGTTEGSSVYLRTTRHSRIQQLN